MREVLCICELIPVIPLKTRLTLLMHWREVKSTSNTGRIATLALPNSEMRVRGGIQQTQLDTDGLLRDHLQPLILFPAPGARELTPELVRSFDRPIHLIVPDGTWRQARKVVTREPVFAGVPCVMLSPGKPSAYQLRSSPHEQNISTLEAVARALGVIESPEVQEKLEKLFTILVERVLWSRGKLQLSELKTGYPVEAMEAFYKDGCAGNPRSSRAKPVAG